MFCLFVCLCVMFWLFIFKWKGTYTLRCSEIYLFSFPSTYTVSHNTQHTPWFCHLLFLFLTVPSLHPSLQGNIQRQKTLCLRHHPVIWKVKHISQENALAAFTWQKKKRPSLNSECHVHAMTSHTFTNKQFWESWEVGVGGVGLWDGYSTAGFELTALI